MSHSRDQSSTLFKREAASQNLASWQRHVNDIQRNDIAVNKFSKWTSQNSYQHSMDAYKTQKMKEQKKESLEQRKLNLTALLDRERNAYQREIQAMITPESARISEMRDRTSALKSAREEKRKQVAEDKIYEHFRANNPDLREMEFRRNELDAVDRWGDQVSLRQKEEEEERAENILHDEIAIARRKMEREEDEQDFQAKIRNERAVKEVLRRQVDEIQARARETERLKDQEDKLLQQRLQLQEIEAIRAEEKRERDNKEHGRTLLRQHVAALKRKSRVVQDELEADLRLLTVLAEQEQDVLSLETERRERNKADAEWMKEVVEDQLKVEKAREMEMDNMFQDEAAKLWAKREAEWEKEKEARNRLMQEVMKSQQEQISHRLRQNRRDLEKSIEAREELLRKLEIARRLDAEEVEQQEEDRLAARRALEQQVSQRHILRRNEVTEKQLQWEEENRAEKAYEELLRLEAERMNLIGFKPKSARRP